MPHNSRSGATGLPARSSHRSPIRLFSAVVALSFLSLFFVLVYKVENFVSQTRTVAGHNLDPTPWHLFPPRTFSKETLQSRAYKILHCSYLTCRDSNNTSSEQRYSHPYSSSPKCLNFYQWIHHDLKPWVRTGISTTHLRETQKVAAFRVVIVGGKLYVDMYYDCVESRAMFTIWGLLQLLRRYPGLVPDVDIMFDCMDKPTINRFQHKSLPLPLFRYCTTADHFDIPFPDWSFWGWPETNLRAWDEEFQDIKKGSQSQSWSEKSPRAYWKGNPDVSSAARSLLLKCNHSRIWGAQIMRQDWEQEREAGFEQSKLSNQCSYRYKIYAEGYAWSVSLKYILSCGSMALVISQQYQDFFSRGLVPKHNYWPVSFSDMCWSIKYAVEWGNHHPSEAEAIGAEGQKFMEKLNMDGVYDYMFHLINEYSKLQKFKPTPPSSALEVCPDSLLCIAEEKQRRFLEKSTAFPSASPPCTLQRPHTDLID